MLVVASMLLVGFCWLSFAVHVVVGERPSAKKGSI